jgi:disulfide bond formation protein DsbB
MFWIPIGWRPGGTATGACTTPTPKAAYEAACPLCWGQRWILEPGPLGLMPVLCTCHGRRSPGGGWS